jgi:DNA (cytosine-5)-methyltransferase 1
MLEKRGYYYDAGDVEARKYGVPQTRRRHILLACKSSPITIPEATHGPGRIPYETVREAISHFPPIKAGETHPTIPNHRASALSDVNLRRIQFTPPDGGDRRDWPDDLTLDCHKGVYIGHTDVYGRMWWDRPAPALTCKCHSLSNGRYGHPEQNRAISLREAAALQTFPDDYVFYGKSKSDIGNQIGNAVPVRLARIVGYAFLQQSEGVRT